jgi:hypothetical protein
VTVRELNEDVMPYVRDGVLDRVAVDADLRRDHVAPRRHLPERVTAAVARRVGALGPQSTSFSACAAGAQAIANAAWAIRRGEVNIAIAGGHDSMIHPLGVLSFIVLGALSPTTCRPFDHGRDGFVIGEGAAMFVLEEESAAIARGATIWARLLGAGNSTDAHNATAPHPEGAGAALSMRRALVDARLPASAVQHVNAHGTGTPLGRRRRGQRHPPGHRRRGARQLDQRRGRPLHRRRRGRRGRRLRARRPRRLVLRHRGPLRPRAARASTPGPTPPRTRPRCS